MMIQGGIWYSDAMLGFVAPTRLDGLAAGMLAHMLGSLQLNPQWVINVTHMNAEVSQIMAKSNASISDSIMKTWEAKGASFDNAMEEGSRERLGIDVYRNPATGDEYTVPNTSQYYWQNAHGQSSAPTRIRRRDRISHAWRASSRVATDRLPPKRRAIGCRLLGPGAHLCICVLGLRLSKAGGHPLKENQASRA
jgi:hypothetical protein